MSWCKLKCGCWGLANSSLFKHNGLNAPIGGGEDCDKIHKSKSSLRSLLFFWKWKIPPSKQSCRPLVLETWLCLVFTSSANLHPTPTIYTLGRQIFQKKQARASFHLRYVGTINVTHIHACGFSNANRKDFFFSFYRNGCLGNENVHRGHGQQRQIVKECIFF